MYFGCVCMVYACVRRWTCLCQRLMSGVLLYLSPFYFLRQSLSLNLELSICTRLAGQWVLGILLSQSYRHTSLCPMGMRTQVLMLEQHFTLWAISPDLKTSILIRPPLKILFIYLEGAWGHVPQTHVEVRGQSTGVSLFPSYGFWG